MENNPLKQLGALGQSIWLDYIRRDFIADGGLRRLIEEDGLRGMTSNPSIFEKAIVESHDYDEDIRSMALKGTGAKEIYEARVAHGQAVKHVASVASFFVSRIDVLVDRLLEPILAQGGNEADCAKGLIGQVAVASAKVAYQNYKEHFGTDRFKKLTAAGARVQRLLWASTGTKDPAFRDVKYVEALIGPDTVDTAPIETLNAFRDHGVPKATLEKNVGAAAHLLKRLPALGIDLDKVTQQLEDEGVAKFNVPFDKLMEALVQKGAPHWGSTP